MADDRRMNRRNFFRNGFRELLKPVVESLDEKLVELGKLAPELGALAGATPAEPAKRLPFALAFLRPPGALPEEDFLAKCSSCGACVAACPADAITINDHVAGGRPFINANANACTVSGGLACMTVCPTGALVPTPMRFIDMGTARWSRATCVRTARGHSCTTCVDVCPIGETAIRLDGNDVQVLDDGCVGCGLCQQHCPTDPKSIVVEPVAARRG